jgi:hypothetical protein
LSRDYSEKRNIINRLGARISASKSLNTLPAKTNPSRNQGIVAREKKQKNSNKFEFRGEERNKVDQYVTQLQQKMEKKSKLYACELALFGAA